MALVEYTLTGSDGTNYDLDALSGYVLNSAVAPNDDVTITTGALGGDIRIVSSVGGTLNLEATWSAGEYVQVQVNGGSSGTADFRIKDTNYYVKLTHSATANRTLTMPDASGTIALTSDITVTNLTGPITSVGNATTIADAELAAIAGLTSAANKIPMFSGSGTATVIDFLDEDTMTSNSATAVPSQQSVKAYVDAATGSGVSLGLGYCVAQNLISY